MQVQSSLAIAEKLPPPLVLLQMATGYWISRAIYVAARLGIADLLKDGPMTCVELAEATAAPPTLFADASPRQLGSPSLQTITIPFGLTPIGASLRSAGFGSMWSTVLTLGEEHYQAWGELLHSIRSGEPAFDHVYGTDLSTYLSRNPTRDDI